LQRQLKEEGLTFRRLVDEARFLEARDLLGEEDVSLIEIAHELSYSDQAHFNHAFRRWAGVTPSQYRSNLQPG
jgi:AraC-like DNA-binding protein